MIFACGVINQLIVINAIPADISYIVAGFSIVAILLMHHDQAQQRRGGGVYVAYVVAARKSGVSPIRKCGNE